MILTLFTAIGWVKADPVAQAVWCAGNQTLYFVNMEQVSVNDTFDGQTVTAVWSGEAVTNSYVYAKAQETLYPTVWLSTVQGSLTTIKFDSSFKDVKPVTFHKWFNSCTQLTNIVGIENLNTSEATSMNCMFTYCTSLTSINLSTFDMSNVTDVFGMFTACTNLETIYCNQTWSGIASSEDMFYNTKLKGYVKDESPDDLSMANPFTGYFTTSPAMTGTGAENDPFIITDAAHWDALSSYVAAGNNCYEKYFRLGRDITVKTCIGVEDDNEANRKPFCGTFIGNFNSEQHVLTVDIDEGSKKFAAPFACISHATIQNVYVKGTVKGGRHAAGLVGSIRYKATINDCRVATDVITTDQYAGGVVGHGQSPNFATYIEGCLFEGTIKRESSGGKYAGAIVGWCDSRAYISVNDCVEKGTYTNFTNTNLNYCYNGGSIQAFDNSRNYNFHKWSAGKQALEIELDDDDVLEPVTASRSYSTSSIVVYNGGAMSYLPEPEDDDDLLVFAASGDEFSFNLKGAGTLYSVTDEDGNNVSCTGSNPYSFTMPAKSVKVSASEGSAYVFKIGTDKLVFAYAERSYAVNETWKGETITSLWSGKAVEDIGWLSPGWVNSTNKTDINTVVFDDSFAEVKPRSMYWWFMGFSNLTTIEGIENLKTSECTNMNSMFFQCGSLTSINVNSFDVSKVTNASAMFGQCTNLETITCDNAWDIETAVYMFDGCGDLKNTPKNVAYSGSKVHGNMANPDTGYFTETEGASTIQGRGTDNDPFLIGTARQWQAFAARVNEGWTYEGQYVKLTADINIGTTMVGTIDNEGNNITGGNPFKGYFDGNDHTITMALVGTTGQLAVAPFRNVDGRIYNLKVTGTITTSGKFAGSIVGRGMYLKLTNCYSDVEITSSVSGDGTIGGLVGILQNPYSNLYTSKCTIEGCVFKGKLLGSSTTHCGGFVGWTNINGMSLTIKNGLFAPAERTFGTSNSKTFVRWGGSVDAERFVEVQNCYYTATFGEAQGDMVYEITDETGAVMPYMNNFYSASSMFVGGNMLMMFTGEEFKYYGAGDQTVIFTSSVNTTAKKTNGGAAVTLNSGSTTDGTPYYYFDMPAEGVTLSSEKTPCAIWCDGNKTLYFATSEINLAEGSGWDTSATITKIWKGNDVTKTGWGAPKWMEVANTATRVVFDPSFADVKPNSLYKWFYDFEDLTTIEGIENLNTSEVTVMNGTFASCESLVTIDVNGFDVSKVTNATTMFVNCPELKTIYCENTWNIATSEDMFTFCEKLTGGVKYNAFKTNSAMANPMTGYFTWNKSLVLEDNENNTVVISNNDGTSGMTVTLQNRTFYRDGDWNTVCLPFGLNGSAFIDSPFSSAISIKELDVDGYYDGEGNRYDNYAEGRHQTGYDVATSTLYLYFKDVNFDDDTTDEENYGDGMLAGVPYLVKWPAGANITNPVFTGVTINNTSTSVTSVDTKVSFIGTPAAPAVINGKTQLYLDANSTLYWSETDLTIRCQRAYFQLNGISFDVKSFVLNFGDGETTGIRAIGNGQLTIDNEAGAWYTLDGRRLSGQPSQRGIYIKNGKKIMIK